MQAPMIIPTEVIDTLHSQSHDAFFIDDNRHKASNRVFERSDSDEVKNVSNDVTPKRAESPFKRRAESSSKRRAESPSKRRGIMSRIDSFRTSLSRRKSFGAAELGEMSPKKKSSSSTAAASKGPPVEITLTKSMGSMHLEASLDEFCLEMEDPYHDFDDNKNPASDISDASSNSSKSSYNIKAFPKLFAKSGSQRALQASTESKRKEALNNKLKDAPSEETQVRSNRRQLRRAGSTRSIHSSDVLETQEICASTMTLARSNSSRSLRASGGKKTTSSSSTKKKSVRNHEGVRRSLKKAKSTSRLMEMTAATTTTATTEKSKSGTSSKKKSSSKSKSNKISSGNEKDASPSSQNDKGQKRTKKSSARRTHRATRRMSSKL